MVMGWHPADRLGHTQRRPPKLIWRYYLSRGHERSPPGLAPSGRGDHSSGAPAAFGLLWSAAAVKGAVSLTGVSTAACLRRRGGGT